MFPFTKTKNSERKIHFAGVLAAVIDILTCKFVYINTAHIIPLMCKKASNERSCTMAINIVLY